MLALQSVTKRYGSLTALDGISLEIKPGEFFGLLGPNGAGKSTTMSLIAGFRSPDSGAILIDGQPFTPNRTDLRLKLGLVPQSIALYTELNAEENLRIFGRLYKLTSAEIKERIPEMLNAVQLYDRRTDRVKTF